MPSSINPADNGAPRSSPGCHAEKRVVLLGTGGTIAGVSATSTAVGYEAAVVGIEDLVAAVAPLAPLLHAGLLECEQVAQIDSKDLPPALWSALVDRLQYHLARPEVCGAVVTHGTDTLEETAYLLHRVLPVGSKPVVLTAAMRPATALGADGPRNLWDAVCLAGGSRDSDTPGRPHGVLVVLDSRVWAGREVRKAHSRRVSAFDAGGCPQLADLDVEGGLHRYRDWPRNDGLVLSLPATNDAWPWVEILTSGAGVDGRAVRALVAAGVDGLVVAGTGHGTLGSQLEAALFEAAERGLPWLRCTRVPRGGVAPDPDPGGGQAGLEGLTPAQARVELMLQILVRRHAAAAHAA